MKKAVKMDVCHKRQKGKKGQTTSKQKHSRDGLILGTGNTTPASEKADFALSGRREP